VPIGAAEESHREPTHSPSGRRCHRRPRIDRIDAELALIIRTAKVIVDDSKEEDERLTRAIQKEMKKW